MSTALERLKEERKLFRKERQEGFTAKPATSKNGDLNLFKWTCRIPGLKNTPFEDGSFIVELIFTSRYPEEPPKAIFRPPLFHVNVYDDGIVCLSLLDASLDWKPSVSVNTVLKSLQALLNNPNIDSPANAEAMKIFKLNRKRYDNRIRSIVKAQIESNQ